jgi:hypothetical protein
MMRKAATSELEPPPDDDPLQEIAVNCYDNGVPLPAGLWYAHLRRSTRD